MDNPPKYPCPALPEGWLRQVVQRRSGLSAGKCDVYYYSPSGEKFRSKFQLGLHLGNVLDISRFDYVTGEMCAEPIKEKSTDGSSSPAKKRGSTKTDTPKSKKKDKIVVKFGSSVHKIPVSALDVKSEDEVADTACNTSLNETSASEGQVSSPVASESKRGRKRKRGSEASPTQLQKAIKQELLDNELAKAQEEFSQTMAEPKQRINGHRKSGKGSVFNFPEVKVNLGEKLGHKELKDTIKTEPSPEQTRQSAARTRVTRPKERRNVFAINMDGHQSPTRRKSPEKAKTSSPSTKKNTKRQKSPPKKSPASPPKTQKRNSSRAAPKAVTNAQGTEAMDLELQQLRKKLMREAVLKVDLVNFLKKNGKPSSLHQAVAAEDHDIVRMLSLSDVGVNSVDSSLETPLHLAVRRMSSTITSLLLDCNAGVNVRNKDLQTPLHLAVLMQSLEIVNLFLQVGADLEIKDKEGQTPLHLAAKNNQIAIVEALVKAGADLEAVTGDGKSPLFLAAENGHATMCKSLLMLGCNIHATSNVNDTPLHAAALGNHVETANVLLDSKADIDAVNNNRETPLHVAAWKNSVPVVQLLFQRGASLSLQDCSGLTPPQRANTQGSKVKAWFQEVGVHVKD